MTTDVYIIPGINPVPWKAPTGSVGRAKGKTFVRMIKPGEVQMFQDAIREALADLDIKVTTDQVEVRFFLWRQIESYVAESGRKVVKHRADATNLQKSLEDALQGVIFANDNQVRHIDTWLIEQEQGTEPCIQIEVTRIGPGWLPAMVRPPDEAPRQFAR